MGEGGAPNQARPSGVDPAVEGYETRKHRSQTPPEYLTYGSIGEGLECSRAAWPRLACEWRSPAGRRPPVSLLRKKPVDLLAVERGAYGRPTLGEDITLLWRELVGQCPPDRRPATVVEMWSGGASMWENGPLSKGTLKKWARLGYGSRGKVLGAQEIGGALDQKRYVVIRSQRVELLQRPWPDVHPPEQVRPMSNLLTPPGLVPKREWRRAPIPAEARTWDPLSEGMPWRDQVRSLPWVKTTYGCRRLSWEEVGRGLGLTKEFLPEGVGRSQVMNTSSVFHWEYVGQMLTPGLERFDSPRKLCDTGEERLDRFQTALGLYLSDHPEGTQLPCDWKPPDLSEGGEWHAERLSSLRKAVLQYPGREEELYQQGLECLREHRMNFTEDGAVARRPRILWWEFPREHWDSLREGSSMNYITPPTPGIHDNSVMNDDQRATACTFVDELIELGVLVPPEEHEEVVATIPLFLVDKPGQPGEWRVIADAKAGGQNDCSAPDPVYLNKASHILDQLYEGGWSAVVDASKFFYQFRTRKEDRPFLGLRHPRDGSLWVYGGLPMGASPSPAHAGRYGLAFLRILKETFGEFQGEPAANTWWSGLRYTGYTPGKGHGYLWELRGGTER